MYDALNTLSIILTHILPLVACLWLLVATPLICRPHLVSSPVVQPSYSVSILSLQVGQLFILHVGRKKEYSS
jgi:hypothetical protein